MDQGYECLRRSTCWNDAEANSIHLRQLCDVTAGGELSGDCNTVAITQTLANNTRKQKRKRGTRDMDMK
jgi:hypothetical protein